MFLSTSLSPFIISARMRTKSKPVPSRGESSDSLEQKDVEELRAGRSRATKRGRDNEDALGIVGMKMVGFQPVCETALLFRRTLTPLSHACMPTRIALR